jgi:epoxyqueuosine reductase
MPRLTSETLKVSLVRTAVTAESAKRIALECGFELAGIARALPSSDYARYDEWIGAGRAGEMGYLTDHRGAIRGDPRQLLPGARSILCVGKLYNTPFPHSASVSDTERAWISRYAWGEDYHDVIRDGLERVAARLKSLHPEPFDSRICVDTAPILERSYARLAGLGWIGRNTCLINQERGSWFFLGEMLLSLDLATGAPPPDRCGTCRRCIDACPTQALIPQEDGSAILDSRLCISYFTIEKRGTLGTFERENIGHHLFGCDICQEVCPWNRRAPFTSEAAFQPKEFAPPLDRLARLSPEEFRSLFRGSPIWRTKYRGFLRNVAIAMGNSGNPAFGPALERLAEDPDEVVAQTAREALPRLEQLCNLEGSSAQPTVGP